MTANPAPSAAVHVTVAERTPAVAVTAPGAVGKAQAAGTNRGAGGILVDGVGGRVPGPIRVGTAPPVLAGIPPRSTPAAGLGFIEMGRLGRTAGAGAGAG